MLSWSTGQALALDSQEIGRGRNVGTVRVRDAAGNYLAHDVMFAFAYDVFWSEGAWMLGGGGRFFVASWSLEDRF